MQPNDTGHTAKQHLQGACKQGKSGISPSRMKVDSVYCSSPLQSSALPAPAYLVFTDVFRLTHWMGISGADLNLKFLYSNARDESQ